MTKTLVRTRSTPAALREMQLKTRAKGTNTKQKTCLRRHSPDSLHRTYSSRFIPGRTQDAPQPPGHSQGSIAEATRPPAP